MNNIILITVRERNALTGRIEEIVSHGFHEQTGKAQILPCETPQSLGARFCNERGEWMLDLSRPVGRAC